MTIYLDNNATTALDPRVLDAMLPFLRHAGNASSTHAAGRHAAAAVDSARKQVAQLVGGSPAEVLFTSGATEADNLALKGLAHTPQQKRRRIVSCRTEHPAVLSTLSHLSAAGFEIILLDVTPDGLPVEAQLDAVLDERVLMASVMAVNNETGVMPDLASIADRVHEVGGWFHTDATQVMTWGGLDADEVGADLVSVSAHKMHGPTGVGALWVRREAQPQLAPLLHGGHHERGLRSGTLNTAGIVGFGTAAALAVAEGPAAAGRIRALRDRLHHLLDDQLGGVWLNGHPERRAPGTLNIAIPDLEESDAVLAAVPEVALSTGSACSAGVPGPSPVLTAMGMGDKRAAASLRLSLSRETTPEEVAQAAAAIASGVEQVLARQGGPRELVRQR